MFTNVSNTATIFGSPFKPSREKHHQIITGKNEKTQNEPISLYPHAVHVAARNFELV